MSAVPHDEVSDVGRSLETEGHAATSFSRLGIERFDELADSLRAAVESHSSIAAPGRREARTGMVMLQDERIKEAARRLVQPLVDKLFADSESARSGWNLYGVNHYLEGDSFKPHQDYFDGTVMITTISGRRSFDVYNKEAADDHFGSVKATHELGAGSVVVLNGYHDLGHAAQCDVGPSISIVADVPEPVRFPGMSARATSQPVKLTEVPAAEPQSAIAPPAIENFDVPADVVARLSEMEYSRAIASMAALSAQFGIDPSDVRVVRTASGEVVVMDGSPNGQHFGSYDAIQARRSIDPNWLTADINGLRVDLLDGTTDAAYRALVVDMSERGAPLPDSLSLSQVNGVPWSATMLTGEPLTDEGKVQVLSVNDGTVNRVDFQLHRGGTTLRVRPSIVVARY